MIFAFYDVFILEQSRKNPELHEHLVIEDRSMIFSDSNKSQVLNSKSALKLRRKL